MQFVREKDKNMLYNKMRDKAFFLRNTLHFFTRFSNGMVIAAAFKYFSDFPLAPSRFMRKKGLQTLAE